MTPQEQEFVNELFHRLAKLESNPRDPSAERLIADGLRGRRTLSTRWCRRRWFRMRRLSAPMRDRGVAGAQRWRIATAWRILDSVRDEILGKRDPRGSVPSVRSQTQSSPTTAPPYPPGPGLAPGMGPAFGTGGSFLRRPHRRQRE